MRVRERASRSKGIRKRRAHLQDVERGTEQWTVQRCLTRRPDIARAYLARLYEEVNRNGAALARRLRRPQRTVYGWLKTLGVA